MHQISDGAVARLVMVNGNLVSIAEIAQILESYEYQQDFMNPDRWNLRSNNPSDAEAALHVLQDGEVIDVYSESPENMLNVNYIAMRFGWSDCELHSLTPQIEQMLMSRLANLHVVNAVAHNPADVPALPANFDVTLNNQALPETLPIDSFEVRGFDASALAELPDALGSGLPVSEALQEDFAQIQHLTLQLSDAEQRAAQFEEERDSAQREVQALKQQVHHLQQATVALPRANPAGNHDAALGHGTDSKLLVVIEKHLGSLLDLSSVTDSVLAKELNALGYAVQVKLVQL